MKKTNLMTLVKKMFFGVFAIALIVSFSSCAFRTTNGYANDGYASVGVNLNVGVQPIWGPVGYDYVEYYYLPDIDVYYYVPNHQYIYMRSGRWTFSSSLPIMYRNYDLYSGYKVVVNEPKPYQNHNIYKEKYNGYRGNNGQKVIRNSHDTKYFVNKKHPEHNKWKKEQDRKMKNDRGNSKNNRNNKNNKNNKHDNN
jgi:hypothetical protein